MCDTDAWRAFTRRTLAAADARRDDDDDLAARDDDADDDDDDDARNPLDARSSFSSCDLADGDDDASGPTPAPADDALETPTHGADPASRSTYHTDGARDSPVPAVTASRSCLRALDHDGVGCSACARVVVVVVVDAARRRAALDDGDARRRSDATSPRYLSDDAAAEVMTEGRLRARARRCAAPGGGSKIGERGGRVRRVPRVSVALTGRADSRLRGRARVRRFRTTRGISRGRSSLPSWTHRAI